MNGWNIGPGSASATLLRRYAYDTERSPPPEQPPVAPPSDSAPSPMSPLAVETPTVPMHTTSAPPERFSSVSAAEDDGLESGRDWAELCARGNETMRDLRRLAAERVCHVDPVESDEWCRGWVTGAREVLWEMHEHTPEPTPVVELDACAHGPWVAW